MIPYGKQWIDQEDLDEVARVLTSDFLTTGPEIDRFEQALCEATGARHAIACSNGTAALHIASLALGLTAGDQVIVPSISFVATANAPHYCGAEVVFADVDPDTALMTPENLEEALTRSNPDRLKAIFVVHMGGHPADMPALRALADKHRVALVEDACHALGTKYSDGDGLWRTIGDCAHSDMAAMSFHPVKTITSGEGGAVLARDPVLAEKCKLFRSHGLTREPEDWTNEALGFDGAARTPNGWYYEMHAPGYNYRLTDFQAALGRSQLKKLPEFAARRKSLVTRYRDGLEAVSNQIKLVPQPRSADSVLHLMVALIDFATAGISRNRFMTMLREKGIGTQVHYVPIHRQPYYARLTNGLQLPGADAYYDRCLSLPLYPKMEAADVDAVVSALKEIAG